MFERMMHDQRAISEVAAEVERFVQRNGQSNEMLGCGTSEGLHVLYFNWVAIDGLEGSIYETWQQHLT